ncbi:MAG TPA: sugar transferase [Chitinophagaceae bacterium]|nr:sugar transferase [Chitinophagaceae bacterium]
MAILFYKNAAYYENTYPVISIPKRFSVYKRTCDILLTMLLLPVAVPGILFGLLVTYFTSKGPVFFVQKRVGLGGKIFTIYKIRTMVYNPAGYTRYTVPGDERVTPAGKLLRKTKMDELPQLLNVLRGEMSLIGPRPERVEIANYFSAIDKNYAYRHCIKPGITGLAQVNYPYATPRENLVRLNCDLYYIHNFSVLLDLDILIKTIGIVCKMQGF